MRVLTALFILFAGSVAAADSTVLERYFFSLAKAGDSSRPAGAQLSFSHRIFGGGTARSRILLLEGARSIDGTDLPLTLHLAVTRNVTEGQVVFALLVFRVEVRGFDANGALIYSFDLPGFTFRDSGSGRWREKLADLPDNMSQLEITFFGNYE